ncbi:hypothetical protein [Streptomyces sp. NEAU-YJ-81]|uniref:hypothetical protein n=1 Tax=Streptomyces sp. NEAU-YJ-81 TaxID=2820288 RepID=UPI001ABC10DD|nr:hypothetical protein [Streptomyces sp. NEAU-YJ-81]MBO3682531.1 hypothetical protein [Streptomyces sp. NEAU-YJ-81]
MRCPAFPEDLIAAQCAWDRTYRALADPAHSGRTTALRRRLLTLSVQVWWHPYWRKAGAGRRLDLRTRARELEREVR